MTAVTDSPGQWGHTSSWQVTHLIRLTENTRVSPMTIHGFAMLALGLALLYIRATMTNLLFYVLGGAFAMLLSRRLCSSSQVSFGSALPASVSVR